MYVLDNLRHTFYKPNLRKDSDRAGSALQIETFCGKPNNYGYSNLVLLFCFATQVGFDENGNARFGWQDKVNISVPPNDACKFILALKNSKNGQASIFHKKNDNNTTLSGKWYDSKDRDGNPVKRFGLQIKKNERSVSVSLNPEEAYNLILILEYFVPFLSIDVPGRKQNSSSGVSNTEPDFGDDGADPGFQPTEQQTASASDVAENEDDSIFPPEDDFG